MILLAVFLAAFAMPLFAQETLPYFNGWEDEAENALWEMNTGMHGEAAANRWYVSSREHFHGRHALLISDLNLSPDTIPAYSNNTINIVAARTFNLPAGTYDLSFAWRAYGEAGCDGLYVAWIPVNEDIATSTTTPPRWCSTAQPYSGKLFHNGMKWTVERTTIQSQGRPMKLAFLWVNDNKNAATPSVCIDDVQIAGDNCGKPLDLDASVNGTTIDVSWTSNPGASYEVRYESAYAGVSDTMKNVRGGKVTLPDMPRGAYDFYVRTVCAEGDTGIWCADLGVIVNEGLCLDYTNLYGEGVTCYVGDVNNPYQQVLVADREIDGEAPRHVVNTDIYETDPRTGGDIRVIPEGEFTSIRLGNEMTKSKGEAIEYDMYLDSGANTVLLMKYAVVLQVPDAHPVDNMPWFRLEILDEKGNLIDPTCGNIYFYSDLSLMDEGWKVHYIYTESAQAEEPLLYKDWTTMGVLLGDYAKNGPASIKVRLTTRDCTQNGHFGYAYFTLDCIEGEMSGLTCGDIPTEEISAPEGFNYKWYREDDPNMTEISDSITLEVQPGDVGTYLCDVISKENPNCFFTLRADLMPRFPRAAVRPVWSPEDCGNYVRFENLSYIETEEGRSDEEITDFEWDFGDGRTSTEKNPVLSMPAEGGELHVTLKASIVDGMCSDVWDTTFTVPAVGERRDTTHVTICRGGEPYIINGMPYFDTQDVELPPVKSTLTGCDSIHVVSITAVESYVTEIDSTVCAGDTVEIGGSQYWFTGDFQRTLTSSGGCDSIVRLSLTVLPEVTFGVEVKNATGGPNTGEITLTDTLPGSWYTVNGEENGSLTGLPVGTYTIVCYNGHGCASGPRVVEISAECLDAEIGAPGEICGDDSVFYLPVEVLSGEMGSYGLSFGERGAAAGFVDVDSAAVVNGFIRVELPDSVTPDSYGVNVVLYDGTCGNDTARIDFEVLYPDSVMKQKWNNVIALKNDRYNGGYVFTSYRWYRNGELMEGETGSYIYLGEGVSFAEGEEFRVEVTRAGDGVRLMSCPLVTTLHEDVQPYPAETLVQTSSMVRVGNAADGMRVRLWSVSGIYFGEQEVSVADPRFVSPEFPGVYVVRIVTDGVELAYKILVRR